MSREHQARVLVVYSKDSYRAHPRRYIHGGTIGLSVEDNEVILVMETYRLRTTHAAAQDLRDCLGAGLKIVAVRLGSRTIHPVLSH